MRYVFVLLTLLMQCAIAVSAFGENAPTGSRAVRKLLESCAKDDPSVIADAALKLAEKGDPEGQFLAGLLLDIGAGQRINHDVAISWLEKAAAQNNSAAKLMLAWKNETGFGLAKPDTVTASRWREQVIEFPKNRYAPWFREIDGVLTPDMSRAFFWMLDAATDAGRPYVLRNLAECYLSNHWTIADASQHLLWLERAVAAGDMETVELLSFYYSVGMLVPLDPGKALALRQKAAEGGRSLAQYLLAEQFAKGDGVEKNIQTAVSWLEKAAKQQNVAAIQALIQIYRDGAPGFPPDFKAAVRLAEQGHTLGDPICTRQLADLYNRGDGVLLDYKKSAQLYDEAAAKGEINAMTMLGWIYQYGEIGAPDYVLARRWYTKAAETGNLRAMLELGLLCESGQGDTADPAAAFLWYERAARGGNGVAQEKMGSLLLQGKGVAKDATEAINWFRLADANLPKNDYRPHTRVWSKHGELKMVINGLIAVAREENDLWLKDNLVSALSENLAIRTEFLPQILQLAESSDLTEIPGFLPEACLAILENVGAEKNTQLHAAKLFHVLLSAGRPQSALPLARYAMAGSRMPRDLDRAARWAKTAAAQTPWQGSVLLAVIESETAPDAQQRAAKWAVVQNYARQAEPEAILAVARHVLAGTASTEEFSWVSKYSYLATSSARERGDQEFVIRFNTFMKNPPPDEKSLRQKITSQLANRKKRSDSPPQLVYSCAPYYPKELLDEQISGTVDVEFIVTIDGLTTDIKVMKNSDQLFSDSAVEAVRNWRFAPGWKNGRAVAIKVSQLLQFSPDSNKPKVAE